MTASTPNCLMASAGIHAAAVLFFLVSPVLLNHPRPDFSSPELTIESDSIRLTDGNSVGGGDPDARPPQARPPTPGPQSPSTPPPPQTSRPPQPTTPPPEARKPIEVAQKPVRNAAPPVAANAQDVDPTRPGKPSKKPIEVAQKPTKLSRNDAAAEEAARQAEAKAQAQAARERAEKLAAARDQYNQAVAARANALRGAAGSLGSTLQGGTKIGVPGKGGEAYAPYSSYLKTFYQLRWKKPTTLNVDHGEVGAEIVVRRDGYVTSFRILQPSGIKVLDDSVREVLGQHRQLRPLPEESEDSERTISIRFDLTAAASM